MHMKHPMNIDSTNMFHLSVKPLVLDNLSLKTPHMNSYAVARSREHNLTKFNAHDKNNAAKCKKHIVFDPFGCNLEWEAMDSIKWLCRGVLLQHAVRITKTIQKM